MADTDLPLVGTDTTITLLLDGQIVNTVIVTRFSAEPQIETVTSKPMGTVVVYHRTVPEGWRVRFTMDVSRPDADEFLDAITAAEVARVPTEVSLISRDSYQNGTSKSYLYPGLKRTSSPRQTQRGQATTLEFEFMTGKQRLAA